MAATLRKRGKKWIVTVHQNGKKPQKTYSVKRDAVREMNRANNALKAGGKIETVSKKDTLNHFIDRWFKLVVCNKEQPLAHGSYVRYNGIYRNKIKDGIGKWNINDLTRVAMIEYFEDLMMDGKTRSDISGRLCVINGGLTKAIDTGHGPGPHQGLIKSLYPGRKQKKKQVDTFTPMEEEIILENTKTDFFPATLLMFRTGMRLGEIMGLDFSAINFKEQYIVVRQSYRSGLLSEFTKTGNERIVPFGDDVLFQLKSLRKKRNEARLKGTDNDAVFVRNGKRLDQNTFRYAWARCLEKCGLDYRVPHTARHTVATRLLDAENSQKLISEIMGHSIQTLLSTYTHKSKDEESKKREMLLGLNAVLEEKTRREVANG